MAPSLLGLPPEVRLEIYRHLLVHHESIQPQILRNLDYYTGIRRAERAISNTRSHPVRDFSPKTAILRTCRQIYGEAVSILYGENTFLYSCDVSIFNNEDYIKVGFPDQNVHLIRHLRIEVEPKSDFEPILPISVAATIQYFARRGCELQTFDLLLEDYKHRDPLSEEFDDHNLLDLIGGTGEVCNALVELQVSQRLIIFIAYCQRKTPDEHDAEGTIGEDRFPDMIDWLAYTKNLRIAKRKKIHTVFRGDTEKDEDLDSENSVELYDEDDPDSYVTTYYFTWCLRPQRSKVQTDTATIDAQDGAA